MNYLFLIIVIAVIVAIIGIAAFSNFELDNTHYERLKWLTMRWSFLVTFIALLVKTFSIPHGVETVAVVAGIGAMMAGLLGISTKNYYADATQMNFNGESLTEMMSEDDEYEEYDDEVGDDNEDTDESAE